MIADTENNEEANKISETLEKTNDITECCGQECGCHDENMTKMAENAENAENAETEIKIETKIHDIPSIQEAPQPIPLTWKESKALKKSKYDEKQHKYDQTFVIQHKRTGQIVGLKALNACMAAGFIGWRLRHIRVLEVIEDQPENNIDTAGSETLSGSSNNSDKKVEQVGEEKE
jgi:hypothetical protein